MSGPRDRTATATVGIAGVVVLCGGTSRRFGGRDKTTASVRVDGGGSILDDLVTGLPPAWPVVCVGEPRPLGRPVTWAREDPPLGGPLAGLQAGLRALGAGPEVVAGAGSPVSPGAAVTARVFDAPGMPPAPEDAATRAVPDEVVVLAGDQPFAGAAAPALVLALRACPADVDAVAARRAGDDQRPQLLLAAYRTRRLAAALVGVTHGRGVHRALAGLTVRAVRVAERALLDVDSPSDLAGARRVAALVACRL